jgi:hypothetical protein
MSSARDHGYIDRQRWIHDPDITIIVTERDRVISSFLLGVVVGAWLLAWWI